VWEGGGAGIIASGESENFGQNLGSKNIKGYEGMQLNRTSIDTRFWFHSAVYV
jgi:hypothetical protein